MSRPSIDEIRKAFPSLLSDVKFMENAVPKIVVDGITSYLTNSYVNLSAGYDLSTKATAVVKKAHEIVSLILNATGAGQIVLGASSTLLTRLLSECYLGSLQEGDEIIIQESNHEANIGPWSRFEKERPGVVVKYWKADPETGESDFGELEQLLTSRTKLVCVAHVSNVLGNILDVKRVAKLAHAVGARVVCDGVAFVPHRVTDVQDLDVDWYIYSTYKVYGPHMAALYGKNDAFAEIHGPNHFFIPDTSVPYKFELGALNHEGCAGVVALAQYLNFLVGNPVETELTRETVVAAFTRMTELEQPLTERLVTFIQSQSDTLRLIGPTDCSSGARVPTVSFVHRVAPPPALVSVLQAAKFACKSGHMCSYRLIERLKLNPTTGVVRVSLLHYNTIEEVEQLIETLQRFLAEGK